MFDFKLPDYEVIIHLHYNEFGKKLEKEILSVSSSYELDESSEYEERKDFHWAFESWAEAVQAGELFKEYCPNPNLLLLKVKANYNEKIKPIVHKDLITPKRNRSQPLTQDIFGGFEEGSSIKGQFHYTPSLPKGKFLSYINSD